MPITFINTTKDEFQKSKVLNKMMPLENAYRTIEDNKLWFANPCTWSDPYERRFIDTQYSSGGINVPFPWRNRVFMTCMSKTMSSEAFWNTYAKNTIGIEFKILTDKLISILEDYSNNHPNDKVFIGKVKYRSRKKLDTSPQNLVDNFSLTNDDHLAQLLCMKRNEYRYEDEYRVIIVKDEESSIRGLPVDVDSLSLIQNLTLDPRIGTYTKSHLETDFRELGFQDVVTRSGRRSRIIWSGLYNASHRTIE